MLCISRKDNQQIQIGPDVFVRVLRSKSGRVTLGIIAPDHISVTRCELDELVTDEQAED